MLVCLFSVSRSWNGLASSEFCSNRVCHVMFCKPSSSSCALFRSWFTMLTHTDLTAADTRVLVPCTMSSTCSAFWERLCVSLIRKRYAALVHLSCTPSGLSSSSSDSGSSPNTSPAGSSISISCTKSCGCLTSRAICKSSLCQCSV